MSSTPAVVPGAAPALAKAGVGGYKQDFQDATLLPRYSKVLHRSSWVQTAEDWESSVGSVKTWLLDQPEPAAQHAERAGKI